MKPRHFSHEEWFLMQLYSNASRIDGHLAGLQAIWKAAKEGNKLPRRRAFLAARAKQAHNQSAMRARKYGVAVCSFNEFLVWFEQHEADACAECGKPSSSVDHMQPLSKGGNHVVSNLQRLCRPCNSRKCAWLPGENREYSFLKSRDDSSFPA